MEEFEQGWIDAVNEEPQVAEVAEAEDSVEEVEEVEGGVEEEVEGGVEEEVEGGVEEPTEEGVEPSVEDDRSGYEAAQAKIKELEHQAVSDSGRVAALTRKIRETQSSISPIDEGVPESTGKWDTLREEYPDIAEGAAEQMSALEARVERMVEDRLAPLREMEESRYTDNQIDLVQRSYPEWQETVHSDDFGGWLDKQPLKVQDLRKSFESEDYIYLLKCYNADKSEQVEEIRSSRENTLRTNVAVPKRGPSRPSGPPDDFDSAFAYYAQRD